MFRAADKSNRNIFSYFKELETLIAPISLKDCESGISDYACWAAEELGWDSLSFSKQRILCEKGVGYACKELASNLLNSRNNLNSDNEIFVTVNLLREKCRNNLYHACLGLGSLRELAVKHFPTNKYLCDKNNIDGCFLAADSDKDMRHIRQACGFGNPDACNLLSLSKIVGGRFSRGNEFYSKSCKLQEKQDNIRPYDIVLCKERRTARN